MSIFDPIKSRENSLGFMLPRIKQRVGKYGDPIGNFACSDMQTIVYGWLEGLHVEYAEFLPRAESWLNQAVDTHEELRFGDSPPFHLSRLHSAKAMAIWMQTGVNSQAEWHATRVAYQEAWQHGRPATPDEIVRHGLDNFMAYAFQCGTYEGGCEAGIEIYERYVGSKEPKLSGVLKPRELGYAYCLHAVRGQFEPGDLLKAGKKMLRSKLEDDWLGRGHASLAAMWLKIVHWHHDPKLTPLQAVLKAYDDMPQVTRPDFV